MPWDDMTISIMESIQSLRCHPKMLPGPQTSSKLLADAEKNRTSQTAAAGKSTR